MDEKMDYTIWGERAKESGWGPAEESRVVRYRRSPNGIYQEVIYDGKYYTYGQYMPEGFVPPES